MDIEILKEFIKAFEGLGSEAKSGFIWYLCFFYISNLISNIMWVGCIIFAIIKVYGVFYTFNVSNTIHKTCFNSWDDWNYTKLEKVCLFLEENFKND